MRNFANTATLEHLMSGNKLTRIEALNLYGQQNLPDVISKLRKKGYTIERTTTTMQAAVLRLQEVIEMSPPKNVPLAEMSIAEYRLVR